MPLSKVIFRSNKQDWETPSFLFTQLHKEFKFTLDVCASWTNSKLGSNYLGVEDDALNAPWEGRCWMNPPYNAVGGWMEKMVREVQCGNAEAGVALVPARTDTQWFLNYGRQATEARFIHGRLCFSRSGTAPFPSVILVYRHGQLGSFHVSFVDVLGFRV